MVKLNPWRAGHELLLEMKLENGLGRLLLTHSPATIAKEARRPGSGAWKRVTAASYATLATLQGSCSHSATSRNLCSNDMEPAE